MKVTPIRQGTAAIISTPNGQSASPEKIARAKAIVAGEPAPTPAEQRPETTTEKLRKIRMKTNVTPGPREFPSGPVEAAPAPAAADIIDNVEPVPAAAEVTQPLSPQYAALAKQKRALQLKESALAAREEALKQSSDSTTDAKSLVERMKADPLGLLLENGVTYDQLTQEVLKGMEGGGPALTRVESELRKELKSLKEAFDAQAKAQTENWTQAQTQELARMQKQAEQIIASDDAYQMIRDTKSQAEVSKLIKRVFNEEGEVLEVKDALDLLENDLLEESLKYARIEKVQRALKPEPVPQAVPPVEPQDGVRRQTMRTLTNRDSVYQAPTSRRERMLAAALGKKIA
jgi:hypothetical protein